MDVNSLILGKCSLELCEFPHLLESRARLHLSFFQTQVPYITANVQGVLESDTLLAVRTQFVFVHLEHRFSLPTLVAELGNQKDLTPGSAQDGIGLLGIDRELPNRFFDLLTPDRSLPGERL
jgi:hypothetical protein